jgi:ATP-dependent 26S proteasome regulatory subunit
MVGATNYPGNLDPALKRSGRSDREIEIGLPDADALGRMFQVYLGDALPLASLAAVVREADSNGGEPSRANGFRTCCWRNA